MTAVAHFGDGKHSTACGRPMLMIGLDSSWSVDWEAVTCKSCLHHRPQKRTPAPKVKVDVCPSCGGPMAIERGVYARFFCPNCGG